MSLQACADIVQKGDPDRFAAAMAAPVSARQVLFPLYAFNVEVARAPWVASEPMIGEMRLQWWRDALDEISKGGPVRKHEVTTPLAEVLDAEAAEALDRLIEARRWDLYKDAFDDEAHFDSYLSDTGGLLMQTAARLLGSDAEAEQKVRALGKGTALVRFLKAVPNLESRGRIPLVDGRVDAVGELGRAAVKALPSRSDLRRVLSEEARAALLEGWETRRLLHQIGRQPDRVAGGRVGQSEFARRVGLLRATMFGV